MYRHYTTYINIIASCIDVCCVLTVHYILHKFDNTQRDGLSQIYSQSSTKVPRHNDISSKWRFVRTRAAASSELSLPRCVSCVPHVWLPEPVRTPAEEENVLESVTTIARSLLPTDPSLHPLRKRFQDNLLRSTDTYICVRLCNKCVAMICSY